MDTASHKHSWVRTLTPTRTTYMYKAIYRHRAQGTSMGFTAETILKWLLGFK